MDIFLTPTFPVGGMENWGLVVLQADTVRLATGDNALPFTVLENGHGSAAGMLSSASTSREQQQWAQQQRSLAAVDRLAERYRVEKVITHELVHQW